MSGTGMTRLAQALGLALHPAVPGFFVALLASIQHEGGLTVRLASIAALVTLACVGVPLAALYLGAKLGGSGDVFGERRETRVYWFYPAAAMGLVATWAIFRWLYPFALARVMVLAAGVVTIGLAVLNRRMKPSIHTAGNAAIATAAAWTYGVLAGPLFLLVPAVAWARVAAGKHTRLEVLVGATIGALGTTAALLAGA